MDEQERLLRQFIRMRFMRKIGGAFTEEEVDACFNYVKEHKQSPWFVESSDPAAIEAIIGDIF